MSAYTKIPIGFKKCMKCGKILPATREFFYFRGGVDREKINLALPAFRVFYVKDRDIHQHHRPDRVLVPLDQAVGLQLPLWDDDGCDDGYCMV